MFKQLLTGLAGATAFLLVPLPAAAVEITGTQIETVAVPEGENCTLTAFNGSSVWPGNALVVTDQGTTIARVEGVEEAPNILTVVDFVPGSSQVQVFVEQETWTSLEVEVECSPAETTTTTAQVTTTSTSTSSTSSSSTTENVTTSTEMETTTTSVPEEPTTTTTVPTSQTTPPTTDPCDVEGACLPDTGSETPLIVAFGLLSVVLGSIMLVARQIRF
jgi:LPXTG-motif cell wall-anchored protein